MERYSCYRSKSASNCPKNFPYSSMKLNLDLKQYVRLDEKIPDQGKNYDSCIGNPQVVENIPQHFPSNFEAVPERKLSKNATAIHDLQDLVTPRCVETSQNNQRLTSTQKSNEYNNPKYQLPETLNPNLNYETQTAEYYKEQLKRVTILLNYENKKNSDALFSIASLEKEKGHLETTLKEERKKLKRVEERYKELQQLFKKQTVINLELEIILTKLAQKHKQEQKNFEIHEKSDRQLTAIIDKLHKENKRQQINYCSKVKELQAAFGMASASDKAKITLLQHSLNEKDQLMNKLKGVTKTKADSELVKDKIGNSTTPSHINDDLETKIYGQRFNMCDYNSLAQNSIFFSKRNRQQEEENQQREQLLDDLLKLKSDIFGGNKIGLRSYSKTDRI